MLYSPKPRLLKLDFYHCFPLDHSKESNNMDQTRHLAAPLLQVKLQVGNVDRSTQNSLFLDYFQLSTVFYKQPLFQYYRRNAFMSTLKLHLPIIRIWKKKHKQQQQKQPQIACGMSWWEYSGSMGYIICSRAMTCWRDYASVRGKESWKKRAQGFRNSNCCLRDSSVDKRKTTFSSILRMTSICFQTEWTIPFNNKSIHVIIYVCQYS